MSDEFDQHQPRHSNFVLIVSKQHVKTVKTALEHAAKLDRTTKITTEEEHIASRRQYLPSEKNFRSVLNEEQCTKSADGTSRNTGSQSMRIPTTIIFPFPNEEALDDINRSRIKSIILNELCLGHLSNEITITTSNQAKPRPEKNPLRKALQQALQTLPPNILNSLNLTPNNLAQSFPETYSLYSPMLLLPSNTLTSPPWQSLQTSYPKLLPPVWKALAASLSATHIAINQPIPPQSQQHQQNMLRSPLNITPLHGDFGPPPSTLPTPTPTDFQNALWVSTRQNGIHQTWAPLYTMFSRGNIREKTRLLHLMQSPDAPFSVADFYAGIGYFAFSYRKGGAKKVVCFELNAWSVEGLRRGAVANGWRVRVWREGDVPCENAGDGAWRGWWEGLVAEYGSGREEEDFWVFHMSNERALGLLSRLVGGDGEEGLVSPVRHVNLGLLPTARLSWRSAARLVDGWLGGWVHVHENVGVKEMDLRTDEVQVEFQALVDEYEAEQSEKVVGSGTRRVQVQHVVKVKTYAPGVVHCVFDVHITGRRNIGIQ